MPNNNSWFQGEYILGRIIITILGILIIIWMLLLCFVELRILLIRIYKFCKYKTARIAPIPNAHVTSDPITSYAKEIPLNTEIIIL